MTPPKINAGNVTAVSLHDEGLAVNKSENAWSAIKWDSKREACLTRFALNINAAPMGFDNPF